MGFLSNFFGGPKPPRPPKELGEIARQQRGYADKMASWADAFFRSAEHYAPQLEGLYEDVSETLRVAREEMKGMGDESLRRYRELYAPLEEQVAREVGAAGGRGRQEEARQMALGNALSGANADRLRQLYQSGARGLSGTPMDLSQNPMLRLQAMIGANAVGNQAAIAERNRGEQVRRSFLPSVHDYYDRAVDRGVGLPARLAEAQSRALVGASGALSALTDPAARMYGTASNTLSSAADIYNDQYKNQMAYHGAKAQRHANLWGNVGQVLGAAIGGATGGTTSLPGSVPPGAGPGYGGIPRGSTGGIVAQNPGGWSWGGFAGGLAEGLTGGAVRGGQVRDWWDRQNWGGAPWTPY